ncbi:PREDICTED: C-C motif chemokine 24 [Dipodomys ordii]|uniref:C-C motif chemokine 24 n=1 Tax=Dipodomys ordii TaxID=10020 RepID=A0A1S3GVR7_DIPOR|nr:PREDICTED: C-C motif chemokine 24 [Dipodomys ordii]
MVVIPSTCCLSFISKKIPESRVVSYCLANRSVFPKAGVMSVTLQGSMGLRGPKQLWVQRYVRDLDARRSILPQVQGNISTP